MSSFRQLDREIKFISFIFLFIVLVFLLSDCEKEKPRPREYPRLNTLPVSEISENGATFNADVFSPGTESITDHGFVWEVSTDPAFEKSNRIILGPLDKAGKFNAVIQTTLKKGTVYNVRSYVKTPGHMVYGAPVTFVSLGSEAPRITGFEPNTAGWMDSIKITGKNFSWVPLANKVLFNKVQCLVSQSTDTTLYVRINPDINVLKNVISVDLAGNVAVHTKDTFRLTPPSISDFYPKQARWGDTLFLRGKYLNFFSYKLSSNYVKLGTESCTYLGIINDSTVIFKIPNTLTTVSSGVSALINGFSIQNSQPFQLIVPVIRDYYPKQGKWGDTLRLVGKNLKYFSSLLGLSIRLGTIPCGVLNAENDSLISVRVPYELSTVSTNPNIQNNGLSYQNSQLFQLLAPEFSFNPKQGTWGNNITLTGNFNTIASRNSVFFDNIEARIISTSTSIMTISVPSTLSKVKTNIIYKATPFSVSSQDTFRLTGPAINPLWLKIEVPSGLIWTSDSRVNSGGLAFSVDGKGYLLDYVGNLASYDPLTNSLSNLSRFNFPRQGLTGVVNQNIFYAIGGVGSGSYKFNSSNNSWSAIASINPTKGNGSALSINNIIYYGLTFDFNTSLLDKTIYEYDNINNSWSVKSTFPGSGSFFVIGGVTLNNTGYYLFSDRSFYSYDPLTNVWVQKASLPASTNIFGITSFIINNKIYAGAGRNTATFGIAYDIVYVYDLGTNSWNACSIFLGGDRFNSVTFTLNNKAYIGFGFNLANLSQRDFYKFDPDYISK
jgi:N-acetylneuraminic acid mutarotase